MSAATPAYDELAILFRRLWRLEHLAAMAYVDRATIMPPKGNEARAAALAELQGLTHRMLTEPGLKGTLAAAGQEELVPEARANLREMKRKWARANTLPAELVEKKAMAAMRCEHAWRQQRPANDWSGFLANFTEVLGLARQEARCLAEATGLAPYDALMDQYEPGMRAARLDAIFADLRNWLPGLIAQVRERQATEKVIPLPPLAVPIQRQLSCTLMTALGFDFEAGRLDESTHPFCGGVPEDVRLTTRYREGDGVQALMGTIHETGHARYEQGLPRAWLDQPAGLARSFGIHESQSLSCEMQMARSPAFAAFLSPLVIAAAGAHPALAPDNLARALTRVHPGYIRVEADELTYPAHVILRYEIERALVTGEMDAADVPAAWDEKMRAWLGLSTAGNDRDGCMQDVHWTEGLFGYFPSYTLGALYAAQWFAALRRQHGDLDQRIAAGDFSPVFDFMARNIWCRGSLVDTDTLAKEASGEALNPSHFRRHLEQRYLC